ncbi:MAG: hypothetical protein KUG77_14820 [Nannocystaceae bacterium]|nr:hypothetical protein [Nannocystaceae bacterium]
MAAGCIPAPSFELPSASAGDPFETDGPYDPTVVPADDDGGTDAADAGSGKTGTTGGGDPSGPWDPSDPVTGGTSATSDEPETGGWTTDDSGGDSETDDSATTGPPQASFPPPQTFGDDAAEAALIGTWTVDWNPDGTPHWSLQIAGDGSFTWTEAAAACNDVADATGVLWTEGDTLVMHIQTWDKRDPWPVESVVGEPLELPFRLHLGYAMALGMLSMNGPWELTSMLGWEGRVYTRDSAFGPAGVWTGYAALEAILAGASAPSMIVRDTYTMETGGAAQATSTTQRTWLHRESPIEQPAVVETGTWFNQTPGQPQGMIWVAGVTHLYDDVRLVGFEESRVFYEEAPVGCD